MRCYSLIGLYFTTSNFPLAAVPAQFSLKCFMATYILFLGFFSVSFYNACATSPLHWHSSSATILAVKSHLHCSLHHASAIRDRLLQTYRNQLTIVVIFPSRKPISFSFEFGKKRLQFNLKPCFSSIEDTAEAFALVKAHRRDSATSSDTTIMFKTNPNPKVMLLMGGNTEAHFPATFSYFATWCLYKHEC